MINPPQEAGGLVPEVPFRVRHGGHRGPEAMVLR